jgi:hypothetical protein
MNFGNSNRTRVLAALSLAAAVSCGGDLGFPTPPDEGLHAPDTMRAVSPLSQPGRIGRPVAEDPTVLVVDQFGDPVGAATVEWEVTAGGGTVGSSTTATGADGKASVTWTLGLGIGVQKLVVRVGSVHGSPTTFTATVLF